MEKKTAFVYHRYSTDQQKDGYSLPVQRKITHQLAQKHDCDIVGVYEDEGISGATIDKRPQMLQLLDDLKVLKPDYIIALDQDRIARGNDFWLIKSIMQKSKTSFITEKEGIIDFADIAKDALSDMMGVFAKYERGMIRQRTKRAIAQRAQEGKVISNPTTMLGYDYDKESKTLKVNPKEAKIVKMIFERLAMGQTMTSLTKELNQRGVRTKSGGFFYVSTLRYMVGNVLFCGFVRHKDKIYNGQHPAIVSQKLFDRANRMVRAKKHKGIRAGVSHLLTGIMRCGSCGGSLIFEGRGKYYCRNKKFNICKHGVCIRESFVHEYVLGEVCKKIKNVQNRLKQKAAQKLKKSEVMTPDIGIAKKHLEGKLKRIQDEYLEGRMEKGRYLSEYRKVEKEIGELESKSATFECTDYQFIKDLDIKDLIGPMPVEDKRTILSVLVDSIVIKPAVTKQRDTSRIVIKWAKITW